MAGVFVERSAGGDEICAAGTDFFDLNGFFDFFFFGDVFIEFVDRFCIFDKALEMAFFDRLRVDFNLVRASPNASDCFSCSQ